MFVDGDTVLHPDFVQRALDAMADERVAAVAGLVSELRPYCSIYTRVLDLDWWQPIGPVEFCGGNALMRRSVLEALGGFDETMIAGEEPELCGRMRAAGHVILHLDLPMVAHDLAVTRWSQYWKRAVRSGHAFAQVAHRFRGNGGFWRREARGNVVHTTVLLGLLAAGVAGSLLLRSPAPVLAAVAVLVALVLRTAWRARRKSPDAVTLLLYGVHTHLQQLPITIGQILFHRDRRRGLRRGLIEYKPWR
jgi:GT2 family glycosyltransferase